MVSDRIWHGGAGDCVCWLGQLVSGVAKASYRPMAFGSHGASWGKNNASTSGALEGNHPQNRPGRLARHCLGRRKRESALDPRQPCNAPPAYPIPMALAVFVAFETFEDVVGIGVTALGCDDGRLVRAGPRAA